MRKSEVRDQGSGIRGQGSGVRGRRSGFTLVEVLIALSISTLVFFAMGSILPRCFGFWRDSTAHWELAQQAKQTRMRLLHNTFLEGNGLLSADYIKISNDKIKFKLLTDSNEYQLRVGETNSESFAAYFQKPNTFPNTERYFWLTKIAHANRRANNRIPPPVSMNYFTPTLNGDVLTMKYTLKKEIGGKSYEQKQVVTVHLINL